MSSNSSSIVDPPAAPPSIARYTGNFKVLFIGPSIDILGGQAIQANWMRELVSQDPGIQVEFYPINPRPPKPLRWVLKVPYLRTLVNVVLYFGGLPLAIWRSDMVHVMCAAFFGYALWALPVLFLSKLFHKPVILNYHDGQADQHLNEWPTAKPTILWADRLVTPSNFLVDIFSRHGVKAQSISNVLDDSKFIYRRRSRLRPAILTNRILEPLYNVDCILRAFRIVQDKYPEATLTIAHDGICRPGLEALAAELKLRNTKFLGRVPPSRIPQLYDEADVYWTTPNIDNMPGSILECFASGLPVVATNVGGIPYISENNVTALLVDKNDHEAVAQHTFALLENPDLVERLTDAAREHVKKYHWQPVRDAWIAMYRGLMAEKHRQ